MARGSVSHITTGLWRTLAHGCAEVRARERARASWLRTGADRGTSKHRTANHGDQKHAVNGETSRRWTVSSPKARTPD